MTWPFENDTSTIIKKLAKADLKEHKLKTLITAIIIVIATCLMATVFSILVNDALKQSTQAPYHAMFRAVSEDTKNKLQTDNDFETVRFLYNGIIIKHQKTEPTYTKTSLFLCEKRRFFMARREKGVVPIIYFEKERGKSF